MSIVNIIRRQIESHRTQRALAAVDKPSKDNPAYDFGVAHGTYLGLSLALQTIEQIVAEEQKRERDESKPLFD